MLGLKGASIACHLVMVPLVLHYVNADIYGIWLTLSSMVAWISFLDIGINNGLKNKLAEALAHDDTALAKQYVSTTYALLSLIFMPALVILLMVTPLVHWHEVLNVPAASADGLSIAVAIIIAYFCINFILSTINVVLMAVQRPAYSSCLNLCQQLLSLAIIALFTFMTKGNLVLLCIGLCVAPIVVVSLFNIFFFGRRYRQIAPSLGSVRFSLAPALLRLGVRFFIIQIAGIVQYQMVNFLIIRHYGSAEVTAYNIAFKYFNVLYMVWGILVTPIWAAVTDAVTKGEISWIVTTVKHYQRLFCLFVVGDIVLLLLSPVAYDWWVGSAVEVSFSISLWVMIFHITMMFGMVYVNVLNGLGLLNVQTIACLCSPVLFLALCTLLRRYGMGVESIIIASVAANFNGLILAPIQYHLYVKSATR